MQQAFLQAWRSAPRVRSRPGARSWLFQITRRVVLDRLRHDRVRPRTGAALDGDRVVRRRRDRPGRAGLGGVEVRRAIDALPEGERVVARLAHVEELSHREIADRLRLPIGTVKSRSARAHGRLAAALAHVAAVPRLPPSQRRRISWLVRGRR